MGDSSGAITCPSCQKRFAFRPELAGKRVKCPKCAKPFEVPAAEAPPVEGEYDLSPEAPPTASVPRVVLAPRPINTQGSDKGQLAAEAKNVLKVSASAGARYGLAGLAGGVVIGGGIMLVKRKPKVFLYIVLGIGAALIILVVGVVGLSMLMSVLRPRPAPVVPPAPAVAVPLRPGGMPPPAMPPGGMPRGGMPGGPGTYAPPTYESLVGQFGADHVVRMTVLNVMTPADAGPIRLFIAGRGPMASRVTTQNGQADCIFATRAPFDDVVKAVSFGRVTASDPDQRTLTVTLGQP